MGVLADTGEHIEHFAAVRLGVLHAVGRDDRQSICAGKIDTPAVNLFFAANEMPLNLDENIFPPKRVDQKSRAIFWIPGTAPASRAVPVRLGLRRLAEWWEISGGG